MRGVVFVAAALVLTLRCSESVTVSDTGYTGTWSRGHELTKSIIAIARVGDQYRFRWTKVSRGPEDDGKGMLEVRCDWEGHCEEIWEGRKIAEYTFRTWMDAKSGHLKVEAHEKRLEPERVESHYVDELVVEPGGQTLTSHTVEKDGETFEVGGGPSRSFTKVADAIASPPPGVGS